MLTLNKYINSKYYLTNKKYKYLSVVCAKRNVLCPIKNHSLEGKYHRMNIIVIILINHTNHITLLCLPLKILPINILKVKCNIHFSALNMCMCNTAYRFVEKGVMLEILVNIFIL